MHHQTLDPFSVDAPATILAYPSAATLSSLEPNKGEVPVLMGSPMVEGRVDPHKKAHFALHISDAIAEGEVGDYTSVKYNHKPTQTTSKRRTRLTQLHSREAYQLTLEDDKEGDDKDVFIFRGQQTVPKKSYVLLFDPTAQKATLEPLSTTYTFNINSKNGLDISSSQPKIYPRKQRDDAPEEPVADDLFGEDAGTEDGVPDSANPFDFRHFLCAENDKHNRGDESEYAAQSSPEYRTGTGSALNTPQFPANRKSAAASTSKSRATSQTALKPTRRKTQEDTQKKAPAVKTKQTPTVRLERRATSPKLPRKPAAAPSSKIKSAEIVHSSDESDVDVEGEVGSASSPPAQRSPSPLRRRPSPASNEDEDEDENGGGDDRDDDDDENNETEDIDATGTQGRNGALASLNLGQSIGTGYANSPGGPISLSAASSIQGSPDPHIFTSSKVRRIQDDDVIDFGDLGGGGARSDDDDEDAENEGYVEGEEDRDVDSYRLGSPAQPAPMPANGSGISLGTNANAVADVEEEEEEEEEEDPLLKEMMEGLAGGSESEESEEE